MKRAAFLIGFLLLAAPAWSKAMSLAEFVERAEAVLATGGDTSKEAAPGTKEEERTMDQQFIQSQIDKLRSLGFPDMDAIEKEMVEIFTNLPDDYPVEIDERTIIDQALVRMGMGKTDYEKGTWEPTSDRVYVFDVEVFWVGRMYSLFLQGISSIMADMKITEYSEDTSQVDWKRGQGTWLIRFACNGKPYEFAAKADHDWFDMRTIAFMNQVLKDQGTDKRLWVTDGGPQMCVLFYNTEAWANEYARVMGYSLEKE